MNAPETGKVLIQPQDLEQSGLDIMVETPDIPPDAVQDRRLCSLPPLETKCLVGVIVNLIVSPSEFYIHVCGTETSDKLWDLMIEMSLPWPNCRLECSEEKVSGDGFWSVDSNFRFLFLLEDTWTSEATVQFQKLCYSKVLVGIVDEYVNGILHLFLCDTSSEEDVYIHSVLKDKGYADICKENLPSQGFKKLNPLALYVQPSTKQESAELVEPDLCLQQDSLGADNEASSFRLDEDELCNQQQSLCAEEKRDDVQPLPDEVNDPKTANQDPEFAQEDTNKTSTDLMAVVKTPHPLGESLRPTIFFKSLEDYFSFLYVKQPAETSQTGPNNIGGFSNKAQTCEVLHASLLLMAAPFMLDNRNSTNRFISKV
ncbi:hypothetical protein CIB84_012759 [Bambusicola thoracicus]|uniref:Uncharacterized protein n=1 Tax=Bambusicola thoracicus TaxID=9083 RepID=A0A2P4SHD5_BAMTH|nr:hypothetical protein CIB84_012759 [Bambusicola thoracicus]